MIMRGCKKLWDITSSLHNTTLPPWLCVSLRLAKVKGGKFPSPMSDTNAINTRATPEIIKREITVLFFSLCFAVKICYSFPPLSRYQVYYYRFIYSIRYFRYENVNITQKY